MKRLLWLLVPLALMVVVVFVARYLIEYTDGVQHEKVVVIPRKMCEVRPNLYRADGLGSTYRIV